MAQKQKIVWLVNSIDIDLASVRYRAFYPAVALQDLGFECELHDRLSGFENRLSEFAAIVIVKRLDNTAIRTVGLAVDANVPVFLDLCDDILDIDYRQRDRELFRMVFTAIVDRLSGIVITGGALKRRLESYGVPSEKLFAVPDCIESEEVLQKAKDLIAQPSMSPRHVKHRTRQVLHVARRALETARHPRRALREWNESVRYVLFGERDARLPSVDEAALDRALNIEGDTVVWFGNHGGANSDFGMLTLLNIADDLHKAHQATPFTLVVVSNSLAKYRLFIERMSVPSVYVPWTLDGCRKLLEKSDACVMPVGTDVFSSVKSANRPLLALEIGSPVVAQPLDSLEPIKDEIVFDDIAGALSETLSDKALANARRMRALEKARSLFSLDVIGHNWKTIIDNAEPCRADRRLYGSSLGADKLLVAISLVQDTPIALQVIDTARSRGIEVGVVVGDDAIRNNPRLLRALIDRKIAPTLASSASFRGKDDYRWMRGATALFCPSETDTPPHSVSHGLTKLANQIGVRTYTAQHGFENLGINYQDDQYPNASIASQTVFTWNDANRLPDWVSDDVRNKCRGVGRIVPPSAEPDIEVLKKRLDINGPVLGVFENLHWKRYRPEYKDAFCRRLQALAASDIGVTVLLVTHPAGLWSHKQTSFGALENLRQFDPTDSAFADVAGSDLVSLCDGVITTPSTIAVDAAEAKTPVAIFTDESIQASVYAPLPFIENDEQWHDFVRGALAGGAFSQEANAAFLTRARMEGDAAARIIDAMFPEYAAQATGAIKIA